jgi:Protein of unknown function (DUF2637)
LQQEDPVAVAAKVVEPSRSDGVRRKVSASVTVVVAVAVIVGSASDLIAIAERWHMPQPWVLPVALDGVGIAATADLHRARKNWFGWCSLLAASLVSAWVRVASAPDDPVAQVIFGAPAVAIPVVVHLCLRTTERITEGTPAKTERGADEAPKHAMPAVEVDTPADMTDQPGRHPEVASPRASTGGGHRSTPELPAPAAPTGLASSVPTRQVTLEDVRGMAAEGITSQRGIRGAMKVRGLTGGTAHLARLLAELEEHPTLEVVR